MPKMSNKMLLGLAIFIMVSTLIWFYIQDMSIKWIFNGFLRIGDIHGVSVATERPQQEWPPPLILGWNNMHFFGNVLDVMTGLDDPSVCPLNCTFSNDRKLAENASVVVFYIRVPYGELPSRRHPQQLYAFYLDEPPHYTWDYYRALAPDFFNITISYRADSDVFYPYDQFVPCDRCRQDERWSEQEIRERIANKTKFAVQINSDCETPSKRERVVDGLRRYVNVSLFGKCANGLPCDFEHCYTQQLESHFFYLAFENAACKNYVTEKFWTLKHLIVPVVLTRAVFHGMGVPDDAYIAADDFTSIRELADYLLKLQSDPDEYMRYFAWTKRYRKTIYHTMSRPLIQKYHQSAIKVPNPTASPEANPLCSLCKLAHQRHQRQFTVPNIWNWWQPPDVCIDAFVDLWEKGTHREAIEKRAWR